MAIEIVDFPMKHGDFPLLFVCSPEGSNSNLMSIHGKNMVKNNNKKRTMNPASLTKSVWCAILRKHGPFVNEIRPKR